jgi:acyl carrier protein
MNDAIWEGLTEIFREVLDNEMLVLKPSLTAQDVPGWDSMRMILIVAGAEERFGVKLGTREIERLGNVGELAALIAAKRS